MSIFNNLEETFNIPQLSRPQVEVIPSTELQVVSSNSNEEDEANKKQARDSIKDAIKVSNELLSDLVEIAKGSEHPRAFEVAAKLISAITDAAAKLDEMSNKSKPTGSQPPDNNGSQYHNHLYVGTTEQLMNIIKNNK